MKRFLIIAFSALIVLSGCSKGNSDNNNEPDPDPPGTGNPPPVTGTPVETSPPNANYPSAFVGQTRIAGVKTVTPYQSAIITSALSAPWGNYQSS